MGFTDKQKDNIKGLCERIVEISQSERMKANEKLWRVPQTKWCRDMWRAIPEKNSDGKIPFTIALDNSMNGAVTQTDLRNYYNDAYTHLETQLKYKAYYYDNFKDNTVFTREAFIWFGVITELSMFGPEIVYFPNREPWIKEYIVKDEEDLNRMSLPDFKTSGLMPRAHEFYEVFSELTDGKLDIMFPRWNRGPFCIAAHLNGLENFLCNMLVEPEFAHKLMRYATDSIKHWSLERSKYLNEPIVPGNLFNDEIETPTMSPQMYEEFVLPYEIELSEFYGGIKYWHSCGNTTDVFELIAKIPNLDIFHVSPWADEGKAAKIFSKNDTALEKCLDPEADCYMADEAKMEERIKRVVDNCEGARFSIRADVFQPRGDLSENLGKIKMWNQVALKVLGN